MIKRGEEKNRKKLVKTGTILRAFQNNLTCGLDLSVVNKGPRRTSKNFVSKVKVIVKTQYELIS